MKARIYAIVVGSGKRDASGVELDILLDVCMSSAGAEISLSQQRENFPGARIKKMMATPDPGNI